MLISYLQTISDGLLRTTVCMLLTLSEYIMIYTLVVDIVEEIIGGALVGLISTFAVNAFSCGSLLRAII